MRVPVLLAALVAAVLAAPAAADTVRFDYAGNEFTEHHGLFPADDRFTGFIVVDLDRVPGKTIFDQSISAFAVVDFEFTDGDRVFFPGNVGSATMAIFTDASGDIFEWSIRVGESVFAFTLGSAGSFYPVGDESFISVGNLRAFTPLPGTWTSELAAAVGPAAVPEPATLVLLALGLGAVALRRRR